MRAIVVLGLTLLVSACASAPSKDGGSVVVRWHMVSLSEVNEICNEGMPAKHRKSVWGGYRRAFDSCVVYTARPDSKEDPQLHDTLGHEVRHCFLGAFHK